MFAVDYRKRKRKKKRKREANFILLNPIIFTLNVLFEFLHILSQQKKWKKQLKNVLFLRIIQKLKKNIECKNNRIKRNEISFSLSLLLSLPLSVIDGKQTKSK